jgi:hypothetical protein
LHQLKETSNRLSFIPRVVVVVRDAIYKAKSTILTHSGLTERREEGRKNPRLREQFRPILTGLHSGLYKKAAADDGPPKKTRGTKFVIPIVLTDQAKKTPK